MKTVEQRSPVHYSPRRQSRWALADYGGKDLWKRWLFSLEWNSVMEGESGEQVGGELESLLPVSFHRETRLFQLS